MKSFLKTHNNAQHRSLSLTRTLRCTPYRLASVGRKKIVYEYMRNRIKKTDHGGPKNGGGHWGKRHEAKSLSKRIRRAHFRQLVRSEITDSQIGEKLSNGAAVCEEAIKNKKS